MNAMTCLLITAVPIFLKTASQIAVAVAPSDTATLFDNSVTALCTALYSVLFTLSALASLFLNVPSCITLGTALGLISSACLELMFTADSLRNNS